MRKDLILSVENLDTKFYLDRGVLHAVNNLNINLYENEILGIVGESGCGKSVAVKSILNMIKKPGKIKGKVIFKNNDIKIDLLSLKPYHKKLRTIRGKEIMMVFQEPMNALSMVHTIGDQLTEAMIIHEGINKKTAETRAIKLLNDVGIPNAENNLNSYPFQLSGGMRQRVMIAIAISTRPKILICDEPTTALDVSVQAQILNLLKKLQKEYGISIIFITHDLGVIAQIADRVVVMYLGEKIEESNVNDLFLQPKHPYTKKLLSSVPNIKDRLKNKLLDTIEGYVPEPIDLPNICKFYNRCPESFSKCENTNPEMFNLNFNTSVRCLLYM